MRSWFLNQSIALDGEHLLHLRGMRQSSRREVTNESTSAT